MNNNPSTRITDLLGPILHTLPDMFILYDRTATILDIYNPKQELMSADVFIGCTLGEKVLKGVTQSFMKHFYDVCEKHQPSRFTFSYEDSKLGRNYYEVLLSCMEGDLILANVRMIYKESTLQIEAELKAAEVSLLKAKEDLAMKNAMLASVLAVAKVIPWFGNLKEGTISCNWKAYHHEEMNTPDADGMCVASITDFFDRIHPDYREQAYSGYMDLIEGRAGEFHAIYPIHWYNDQQYDWVEAQAGAPEYSPEKDANMLIGSVRVVTAQKEMEESLRKAKEDADRSNTFKSAFLANMSHEIRTPLNAIVGFSELLADAESDEEKEEYLSIIRNSNALLLQLIADILDISKIEAGTLDFSFEDHDLDTLLQELEQTARMKVDNPAISVACENSLRGCTIHTDRGRLLQVLHNFINNAAKFTVKGHIHIGFKKLADGRWYFYVEDTGCGMPPHKVGSVFDRFVKLDAKAKGTGLGLAISKSIVERFGGEIGGSSIEGEGSTFWFILPAGSITVSAPISETVKEMPKPTYVESGQTTILIAEDDQANYKLFEAMLKKHYRLAHAWNGREAVEMFRESQPNLILMDIKMPVMDGYAATTAIRKLSPHVPIIAVTAFASPEDMRNILSSGFNGCLPKPINMEKLKSAIYKLSPSKDKIV